MQTKITDEDLVKLEQELAAAPLAT